MLKENTTEVFVKECTVKFNTLGDEVSEEVHRTFNHFRPTCGGQLSTSHICR